MKRIVRLLISAVCMVLVASTACAALPENFVVRHGSRDEKKIAITVDDCYDKEILRQIHALSIELDFPITWFVIGAQFLEEDKEVWEDIIARGNEIGNHTWKHSRLLSFSAYNARTQILLAQERVDQVLGYHYPLRIFRPPYGGYKNEEKNFLNLFYEYGVEKVVLWDVSNTDPEGAFKDVQNGSILLYHTNKKDYECLKVLIPMLQEAGYELVTISELLGLEPLECSDELYVYPY